MDNKYIFKLDQNFLAVMGYTITIIPEDFYNKYHHMCESYDDYDEILDLTEEWGLEELTEWVFESLDTPDIATQKLIEAGLKKV